jgi:hypothetical protein
VAAAENFQACLGSSSSWVSCVPIGCMWIPKVLWDLGFGIWDLGFGWLQALNNDGCTRISGLCNVKDVWEFFA